jgi:peptide/nickel transport system permease protein
VVGTSIGILCGYFLRWVDAVVMRFVDVLFAFPVMLLALLMIAIFGPTVPTVIAAIALVYIPHFARVSRAATMGQMQEPYVGMLRSIGARGGRIMFRHILPNITAPLLVQLTFCASWAILVEASLSFLGLGVQPPAPSLGSMIADGQTFLSQAPWVALVPAAALFVVIGGLNLLGDGLRDALALREDGGRG